MVSKALLVALSGPSCSGKTTLARLIRKALHPHAFILHEDDFYKTDAEIPTVTVADGRKLQDWDCLDSVDVQGLSDMLRYIKEHGRVTNDFKSKEDENVVRSVAVDDEVMHFWRAKLVECIGQYVAGQTIRIAIIDGFLLYSEDMKELRDLFDVKLLLKTSYDTVKERRERRKGYVTLEGFWEDPEGYVDLIVWPNYVKDHSFLYTDGDVNGGAADPGKLEELGISEMPSECSQDITACFEWACGVLCNTLNRM